MVIAAEAIDWPGVIDKMIVPACALIISVVAMFVTSREKKSERAERIHRHGVERSDQVSAVYAEFIAALLSRKHMQLYGNPAPASVADRLYLAQAKILLVSDSNEVCEKVNEVIGLTETWGQLYRQTLRKRVGEYVIVAGSDGSARQEHQEEAVKAYEALGQAEDTLYDMMRAHTLQIRGG